MTVATFTIGEVVSTLNTRHPEGTRLRTHGDEQADFNEVRLPNHTQAEIVEVQHNFLKIRTKANQEGWIQQENVVRAPSGEVPKNTPGPLEALASTAPDSVLADKLAQKIIERSSEATPAFGPGARVKDYIVEEKIGAGGMGAVYRGYHPVIESRVAIKLLHPRYAANEKSVARFLQEAIAANKIGNKHIIKIFDFGALPDNSPFFIMELLEGRSLASHLAERGTLPFSEILPILRQVCDALSAAHEKGIIHRDLKPDNIFLVLEKGAHSFVKVLDFGIAKLSKDPVKPDGQSLTNTGALMGTAIYMSPEQCRGAGEVDHRTDIYALGIILFEMLTGRTPFYEKGDGPGDIISKQINQALPSASSMVSGRVIPEEVEGFLRKTLSKDPSVRPQQSLTFFSELERVIGAHKDEPAASVQGAKPIFSRKEKDAQQSSGASLSGDYYTGENPKKNTKNGRGLWFGVLPVAAALGAGAYFFFSQQSPRAPIPITPVTKASTTPQENPKTPPSQSMSTPTQQKPEEREGFALIEPPSHPVTLGLTATGKTIPEDIWGFRPEREVLAPSYSYFFQQYETTWGELDPWLDKHPEIQLKRPKWASTQKDCRSQSDCASLPVSSIPWALARSYCNEMFQGDLPSEEEWEYAARGQERRPYPWGEAALDAAKIHIYQAAGTAPVGVTALSYDKTPNEIYGLQGNVQEWTLNEWSENEKLAAPEWAPLFRVVRGLPLIRMDAPPQLYPKEGAAYRDRLCVANVKDCPADPDELMQFIGFRCSIPLPK